MSASPRNRKRKQQAARKSDKEEKQHSYKLRPRKGQGEREELSDYEEAM